MQFATAIPFVSCVKCGERLFLPEASEYAEAHSVRHRWKCGRCDHSFETAVDLGIQRGRRRSDRQRPLSTARVLVVNLAPPYEEMSHARTDW
jgi:ribosomal protein S27AE